MNQSFRATPPSVATATSMILPPLQRKELANGIPLYIYNKCDSPVNYISAITTGGEAEARHMATAALTSITQREGSVKNPDGAISEIMDYNGSWLKSTPMSHFMQHSMFSLNANIGHVLPVFADMLYHPTFPEAAYNVRREALARNLEVSAGDVSFVARCESDRQAMGATHPLARTDTPEEIRGINADEIRTFAARHITPGNTALYLCGEITPEVEQAVADTFGSLPTGAEKPSPLITRYTPAPEGTVHKSAMPGALQTAVCLTMPAIPRHHPHYLPLHLTVMALGGYFGSRLMLNIREEKGLTYGIGASLLGQADGAYTLISCETDNDNVTQLIDEIRAELTNLCTNPCRGDELYRLKQCALSQMASTLDSPFSITDYHITMLTTGIPEGYFENKIKAIHDLTADTIADMARLYLNPDTLRIAMAGNFDSHSK